MWEGERQKARQRAAEEDPRDPVLILQLSTDCSRDAGAAASPAHWGEGDLLEDVCRWGLCAYCTWVAGFAVSWRLVGAPWDPLQEGGSVGEADPVRFMPTWRGAVSPLYHCSSWGKQRLKGGETVTPSIMVISFYLDYFSVGCCRDFLALDKTYFVLIFSVWIRRGFDRGQSSEGTGLCSQQWEPLALLWVLSIDFCRQRSGRAPQEQCWDVCHVEIICMYVEMYVCASYKESEKAARAAASWSFTEIFCISYFTNRLPGYGILNNLWCEDWAFFNLWPLVGWANKSEEGYLLSVLVWSVGEQATYFESLAASGCARLPPRLSILGVFIWEQILSPEGTHTPDAGW